MKKTTNVLFMFLLLCLLPWKLATGTPISATATITWPFDLGTTGQVATYSTGTSEYFSTNWVDKGSNLSYKDVATNYNIKYTRFQPVTQSTSIDGTNLISFNIRPTTGLNFTPTSISFDCMRYGTDGGSIDVVWKSSDGTTKTITTALKPARDNSGAGTHATYDLSALSIPASNGDCALYIYIYSLGNTKQIGIGNVVVNGTVTGEIVSTTKYNLTLAASPSAGGTVSCSPVGTTFDEGTSITVNATRGFGYKFSHWTSDGSDNLSTNSSYTFTLSKNTTLSAVFETINTYSLTVNATGGAQNYMVVVSPAGTLVNGQTMYEEGTSVSLTANGNQIFTFTNWLTGETNSTLTVPMTQNQNITAVYSAVDYIVGWDFYKSGGSSRPADFYSTSENQTAALILRKADGTLNSWLDKSNVANSVTYGSSRGSGINWKPLADQYYYQTSFSAKDFTDIKVSAGISYGYNAYTTQKCEYSLDGTNFTSVGTYAMPNTNTWYDNTFSLPADANHADKVYVRWIPDYTSALNGTTAANNDGTTISNIFITATASIYNDGVPPVLSSSVPVVNSTTASATGKVVLTFDEKVKIASGSTGTATMGSKQLTPVISGKTITFPYSGLDYDTQYTFTLPANSVSDLSGNTLATPVSIDFKTMVRPTVTKKLFDFVVGVDGDFKAALTAATAASTSGDRFRIFFPKGEYNIGELTGDANQKTNITLSNISLIGEKDSSTVLFNKPLSEGISVTATLAFTSTANNIYMQDMTLLNKLDYRTGTFAGRAAALQDQGTKNIYKNVHLLSNQDTYYSGSGRLYFEGGSIHGTVDFICGGGDVFFNECLLYIEDRAGNCITAPATTSNWGYVFSNCKIDGYASTNGNFSLGRPWQNAPRSIYINSRMNILPSAAGWAEMGVAPALFAEYNSTTSAGANVDLSSRKTSWVVSGVTTTINPVLTKAQADQYTLENVLGGSDSWQPNLYTEQAPVPVITLDGRTIKWDDSNYVLCWAIIKDGVFVKFVATNSYSIPQEVTNAKYMVRAANEMGGLSANSNEVTLVTKLSTAITWNDPQPITYGTALSETQLNATASGNTSSPVYNPAKGTVLPAGTNNLSVTFPEDANYGSASKIVTILVNKASSSVTWSNPADMVYGTALSASQLNATVSGTTGAATYMPALGTVLTAGTHDLTVTFAGDDNFNEVSKTVSVVVKKAPSVITWANPADIVSGTALSATQLNATVSGTTGAATYTPALGTILPAGTQTLTVTFGDDANYEGATKSVTINVTNPLGVETIRNDNVEIYPNPTDRIIKVKIPFWKGSVLTVTTVKGEVVLSKLPDSEIFEIDLKDWPAGTYLFRIISEKGSISKQVIKN